MTKLPSIQEKELVDACRYAYKRSECFVCGSDSPAPIRAALSHFRIYESGNWKYLLGNMGTFGKWRGFISTLGLAFPFFNTIRNWKYRKHKITFDGLDE